METQFSVLLLTAPPPRQAGDAGGAFLKIDGREAMLRSIELFLNRDAVCQIQIAVAADLLEQTRDRHGAHFSFSGVRLVSAGARWVEQITAGAARIDEKATHVLVHDAARVAVPAADLDAVMDHAQRHEAVALVAPVRSTLVEVDEGGTPMAMQAPAQFRQWLTPRVYTRRKFMELAEQKAEAHPSIFHLVEGSPYNVRLGGPGDVALVKAMLGLLPRPKTRGPNNPFEEAQW